jgi:hypothetical protein
MITVNETTGTVTIVDFKDSHGNAVEGGWENLLLQLAIDRASANTARVSLLQLQLRAQTDHIVDVNAVISKLLNAAPGDPSKNGEQLTISLSAADLNTLNKIKDSEGFFLSSYFESTGNPAKLAATKSYNDLMTAIKSELNQATNQNQQSMVNYQSLINQRNQMAEWVGNLITLLASTASATTNNFR